MRENLFLRSFSALVFTFFLSVFASGQLLAQENCNNGIDDDGDNLVDVFDPDCPCDNEILLCEPTCEFSFPGGALNFQSQWTSAETIPVYQTPLVADIDNDNTPEVVILSSNSLVSSDPRRAKDLLIINGATGNTELTITTPFLAWVGPNPVAIADIDDDGFGEIIVAAMDHPDNAASDRRFLFCYEHTGAIKWKSDSEYGYPGVARFGSALGIADMNSDGIPEVYVYNQVFNALTGVKLAEGGSSAGMAVMTRQPFGDLANPVAADLTSDPGLELACGNTVYEILIANTAGTAGNTITPITILAKNDGYTSLADIDLDGNLDVIVASEGSNGEIYVWNPNNGSPSVIASQTLPNTGGNWIGVPFVGDMDKDCEPEIGVTRATRVFALDYDGSGTLQNKWTLTTTDASGFTGITMFDFNQDGTQELVYRDESTLRIIDGSGSTPVTIGTNTCGSGTGSEMPVVADVDGDGQAEICVSCQTSTIQLGQLNVFEATGQPWAPCRSIWNQFNYFNININSDLSVPLQQQQHQVLLSTVTCPFSTCSENRPFNSFLTQATFLTQEGCPIYPAADISLSLVSGSCSGSTEYNLSVRINNIGGGLAQQGFPVRFYVGNPFTSAATELVPLGGTAISTLDLLPGQTETISVSFDILSLPKPFNLFAVLNDDGTTAPPFNFPLSSIPDCNYGDNVVFIPAINCCPFGDLSLGAFTPAGATLCEGENETISVTASSSAGLSNATFTWTAPDNTSVSNDSILVAQNGTYVIVVEDDAQCVVSDSVDITVFPLPTDAAAGADQTICFDNTALEGNVPAVGTGQWTLISGSGTIANSASPTSNVSGIAVGTSLFEWKITSGGICISVDTVAITRIPAPSPSNAGSNQDICADNATLAAVPPTVGIGTWSLVSGSGTLADPSNAASDVTNLSPGANVFQWSVSNGICPVSNSQVTITRFENPLPPNAGADQQICADNTTINATSPTIGIGVWTLASGSGTIADASDNQTAVSDLGAGNNVFRWTVTNGVCPSVFDEVTILRDLPPSTATVGADQQICSASGTINATTPLIGTGIWTVSAGSATLSNASDASTSVNNLSIGPNTFTWTVSNGNCPPSTAVLSIQRDEIPTTAVAGNDQQFCGNNAELSANTPTIGTGIWSISSGNGNISNPSSPSTSISNLAPGINQLAWTISNGSCPPSVDLILLTSDELIPANAGADQSICSTTATLAGNSASPGTGVWTIVSGSGTISNPTQPNSVVEDIEPGTVTLEWTITNGLCISRDTISITRTLPPSEANAGTDQTLCATTTVLEASIPVIGAGAWSVLSGSATFENAQSPSDQISGLAVGNNILIWTVSSGVCQASADTVTITVSENPVTPNAGEDQSLCADNGQLNALSTGNGTWTLISGSGTIANPNQANSSVSNLGVGENVFRWTEINGVCEAFDQVTITRFSPPSAALAGADQAICLGEPASLSANTPTLGTGTWNVISGNGTLGSNTNPTTIFNATTAGSITLEWSVSNGVCPTERDSLIITVNEPPSTANAGNDVETCADTAALNAINPISGTGIWSIQSGSANIGNNADPSTSISGLSPGVVILVWTVSTAGCEPDSDLVSIQINAPPNAANAGEDAEICNDSLVLSANTPTSGIGSWSVITGSGVFANASNPNTNVANVGVGVNVYQWTISNGVCPPSTDQIVIQRDSVPVVADAGSDLSVCATDSIILQAIDPFPGSGQWQVVAGSGVVQNPADPNTLVTGLSVGLSTFRWIVTTGDCPPQDDSVNVFRFTPPSQAVVGNDTSICSTAFTISANTPETGTGAWSILSGSGSLSDPNAVTAEASNLSSGVNQFVWTITNGDCPSTNDTLTITISKNPITPNAGPDLSICADTATLSAAEPSVGTGVWTIISGGATLSDTLSPNAILSNIDAGTLVLQWTVTNESCIASDQMEVTRSLPPDSANAGEDLIVCDSIAQLNANLPIIGNGVWSIISGGGILTDPSNTASTITALDTGVTVLRWTISNGVCPVQSDDVLVTRNIAPDSAYAGEDLSICADTAQLNAEIPALGTGVWSIESGTATIENMADANSNVSNIALGTLVLRWTISNGDDCPAVFDEITITRNSPPDSAIAGDDQLVCTDFAQLSANSPTLGIGQWIVVSGNAVVASPDASETSVTGLSAGNNVLEWRISNGSCPETTDQITIVLGDTAFAGDDIFTCDSNVTLNATVPLSGSGFWTVVSGTANLADSSSATSAVSSFGDETVVLLWTILGSACNDTTDEVQIIRFCSEPPIITNDSLVLLEDSVLTSNFLNNGDIDPDGSALVADTIPEQGPLHGTIDIGLDGSFTYTPNENYYGNDTVVVQVCDSALVPPGQCGFDTLFIVVQPVNDTPLVQNDQFTGPMDSVVTGNILENDSDPVENTSMSSNTVLLQGATNGVFVIDSEGNFTYTPNPGFTGQDTIVVAVCDSGFPLPEICLPDTVVIFINDSINEPPNITNDSITIFEDQTFSASFLNDDFDPDGTTLLADTIPLSGPNHGTVDINPDGTFTYTPDSNYFGVDTIIVNVCDQGIPLPEICLPDTIIIVILPLNDAPIIENEYENVNPGDTLVGNILLNDYDIDSTNLSADTLIVDGPNNGTFTLDEDGTYTYIPDPGFTGIDTIVIAVCDSGFPLPEICANDTVFISIGEVTWTIDAGEDQTLCGFEATLFADVPPEGSNAFWDQVGGSAVISDPSNFTSFVSGLSPGDNIFIWSVTFENSTQIDTVIITSNEPASPSLAGQDQTICGDATTLEANVPDAGIGVWINLSSTAVLSDSLNNTTDAVELSPGVNEFVWLITNGNCTSSDTVLINSFSPAALSAGPDTSFCGQQTEFTPQVQLNGTADVNWSVLSGSGSFSNDTVVNPLISGLAIGSNTFIVTATNGACIVSDTLTLELFDPLSSNCNEEDVFIPEGFSPDGDGRNDQFVIYYTQGRTVSLEVYNRWGNLVYKNNNYLNDWNGTANQGTILYGEALPESTYYYLINIDGETTTRKGYLTLWR
jgi:gliding motility-associated-like protein